MNQPIKGFIPWVCIIVVAFVSIYVGNYFGLDPLTLSVYTLFACWFAFIISYSDKWPLGRFSQPLQGVIFLVACVVYGIIHPFVQVDILNFGPENYWPIIANLFLALGITAAFDNKLVEGLKQPKSIIFNVIFWYLIAFVLLATVGMVPSIWFAFFVLYFFWFEKYPFLDTVKQPYKGILSFCVMGGASLVLEFGFRIFGTSFVGGNLVGPVWFAHWVFWLVTTSWVFKNYPFEKLKQPLKGIAGTLLTVPLALASFLVTNSLGIPLTDNLGYAWVFVSWVYLWPIVLGHWPARDKERI